MNTEKLWLLDAHCDSFEMRNFLEHDFNLGKGNYKLSPTIRNFLKNVFKTSLPSSAKHAYHVTFSRLQQGGVRSLFLNIGDYELLQSSFKLDAAYELVRKFPTKVLICNNAKEIYNTVKLGKLALLLTVEDPCLFQGQVALLKHWNRLGVKVVSLTHGEGSQGLTKYPRLIYKKTGKQLRQYAWQISTSSECYLSSAARSSLYKKEKGLNKIGKQMLQAMTACNIVCDLAHANDRSFWETLETTTGKVCVTHANCAALCGHTRNLTNEMMRALAQRGGVMGLCFYGNFIDKNKPSLLRYVDHILHALSIMGPNKVGIGTDYDGVPPDAFMAIPHPARMQDLWEALDKAGVDQETMQKIAHENFLNLIANFC